jgi:hypothetical protein
MFLYPDCAENNATFISGGVDPDKSRSLFGNVGLVQGNPSVTGVFKNTNTGTANSLVTGQISGKIVQLDNSLQEITGPENSPRTLADRVWRRTS